MEYTELGATGLEVSEISMGLWSISNDDTWGDQDEEQAIAAIREAIDAGITFFDTAEAYGGGYSEEVLGQALEGYDRSDLTIATKVSAKNLAAEDLKTACRESLDRLNTDYVDVYYIHWPNHDIPLSETVEAMAELQEEGLIRVPACSNFGPIDLQDLLDHQDSFDREAVSVDQLPYNLLWRAVEYEIEDVCLDNDVGVVAYSPLAQGMLADLFDSPDDVPDGRAKTRHFSGDRPNARHAEAGAEALTFETIDRVREICSDAGVPMVHAALNWVLSRSVVDCTLVGGRNPREVRDSASAVDTHVSENTLERLTAATEDLKAELGSNPDMWWSDSRYR